MPPNRMMGGKYMISISCYYRAELDISDRVQLAIRQQFSAVLSNRLI